MSSGLLTPDARLRVFSDLGLVSPGAKLNTYVSGTPSTPLTTYSDVTLLVPNANPVVASAGGLFGPIYLTPGVAYKYVLTDAAGNAIWSQDPVTASGFDASALTNHGVLLGTGSGISVTAAGTAGYVLTSNGASADPTYQADSIGVNDFRLTLESGVPVSSTDQLAKTTVFCTPAVGNRIDLYDAGGVPTTVVSAQFSIAVPATTSQLYSVFVYNNAGVATLELAAWTNDTTPGTAAYSLSATTGTRTKTGDLTRRFLGLMRTTTVSGQCEFSLAKRYLWNDANRVLIPMRVTETTDSWTYTLATYRQANGVPGAGNQCDLIVGVADSPVRFTVMGFANNTGASVMVQVAIGENSITTPATGQLGMSNIASATLQNQGLVWASLEKIPAIGRNFYAWLERSVASGITTWYGDNADATLMQMGISGDYWG